MAYVFETIIGCGLFSILYATIASFSLLGKEAGTSEMQHVAQAICKDATAYLWRQYFIIGCIGAVVAAFLALLLSPLAGLGFFSGAVFSGLAGFIGMSIAVKANVRTTQAARLRLQSAFAIAFKAGAIIGHLVVGLALLGITCFFWYLVTLSVSQRELLEALLCLSFGASLISIFARLGGGIFTKGADIGADLVGKFEARFPEDDPRNPAVIADNVGDNVGDCVGMAADLFETYVATLVGTMLLAAVYFRDLLQSVMILYPLMIGAACILGSIIGIFFVSLKQGGRPVFALYRGLAVAIIISAGAIIGVTYYIYQVMGANFATSLIPVTEMNLIISALTGLGVAGLLVWISHYFTSTLNRPVRSIAQASLVGGHAANIIQGLAIGMEATILPVIVIATGIIIAYMNAGIFGISIAATSMLALAGMIITMDAFGPVVDNAGGIAKMAYLPQEVREITDLLDSAGNTTKAVTKSYSIGATGFSALVLFAAYTEALHYYFPYYSIEFSLKDPFVFVGLLIGGVIVHAFCAMAIKAVCKAGRAIVTEVRYQFKEFGVLEGKQKPDYGRVVVLLTKAALAGMIIPALLPVLAPIVLFGFIGIISGEVAGFVCLGAMLMGTVIVGLFMSISMTSGGGAWDNTKKLIEEGHYGGKGSYAHIAALTGDVVGDPYKDTAGPAINPLIKIVNIVAILLLAILAATR